MEVRKRKSEEERLPVQCNHSRRDSEGEKMMRNYATQMEAARKGIVTPELESVAKRNR